MRPDKPTTQPPWHPCLRRKFFIRRHPKWGPTICWHQWSPVFRHWCIAWGPASKTIPEAKRLRRFLNNHVARWPSDYGVPFEQVVEFVRSNGTNPDAAPVVMC